MIKIRSSCLYFSAVLFLLVSLLSSAQQLTNNKLNIPKTDQLAVIDGDLTDSVWNDALSISLNIVNNPWNNLPSPVETKAKIIENGKYIYISFIAFDPEPNKINGFLGDRDSTWNEDLVGIKLDTFNNKQLNYNFFVNPFGVQNDSISNELTGDENQLWDANWQSFGKKTPNGYQVEIAIPYNILNFDNKDEEKEKIWGIEFVRFYPRDERLRISHVKFDKNNNCWLCQIPEIKGFKNLKSSKNITITPSLVASNHQQRNPFGLDDKWSENNNIDPSVDIRWAPTANTLLNTTINPDFSTVESDSGQLSVNNATSLYFDEKRTFFLENSDYFSSNYNIVYTRNIADPDYGAKLTSRTDKYSYGIFITNDQQTNFIVPGNISDDLAILNTESHSAALNYHYHYNEQLTLGLVSTLRAADEYHNALAGVDVKYKVNDSHTISAQFLYSDTEYPAELFEDFCLSNSCETASNQCTFGNCRFTEQVNRTNLEDSFSDTAYKIDYQYNNEFWDVNLKHQKIDNGFRADLGFISQVDIQKNEVEVSRLFYGAHNDFWSETSYSGAWYNIKNENGEFIERAYDIGMELLGPKLSLININIIQAEKTGLRHDDSILNLANNTTLFDEQVIMLYAEFQPINRLFTGVGFDFGDQIDYLNNRLGSFKELYVEITANPTDHLSFELIHTLSQLEADPFSAPIDDNVFTANLTNFRISYQFDVESFIKLSLTYVDVEYNIDNNPIFKPSNKNKDLSTQLIYSYKLNPQTVFFLGYSDNSFQNDDLSKIYRTEKTFFTKISYAWSL